MILHSLEGDGRIWAFLPILPNVFLGYALSFNIFNLLTPEFILLNLAIYFIVGAMIGLFGAKIKNKNKNKFD